MPKKLPKQSKYIPLTERDRAVLNGIYRHEGLMSDYQIQYLYFPDNAYHTMYLRLKKLVDSEYLVWADQQHRAQLKDYTVCYLGERGIEEIADGKLRDELIIRRPYQRWGETRHDVFLNDFRIAMTLSVAQQPQLMLADWITEQEFWHDFDRITFTMKRVEQDENGRHSVEGRMIKKRAIRPDGLFIIEQENYQPSRFLVEIDRGTERTPREWEERLHGLVEYILSEAYKRRFGHNAGRVLLAFESEARMVNVHRINARTFGDDRAATFHFTTADQVRTLIVTKKAGTRKLTRQISYQELLFRPIWYRGTETEAKPLLTPRKK